MALLPRLADTRDEIVAVAEFLGADLDQDVYLGLEANETVVKSIDLTQCRVVSFATHGLVSGDLDGLNEPALALTNPLVLNDSRDDGLLTMSEILGLKFNADWVVLSACNTASPDGETGEAISGLGRAFFYAGSKSILVSNWPVHSAATTALMTNLFKNYEANNNRKRANALQSARRHLVEEAVFSDKNGDPTFSYAHPLFWAPFGLVGDS